MGITVKIASLYVGDFLQKHKREWFHINRFLQVRSLREDEVEQASLPASVLSDPYVKGYKLLEIIAGARPSPDPASVAKGKPYESEFELATRMCAEIAKASEALPDGVGGAKRAIHLFEAARKFLVEEGRISETVGSRTASSQGGSGGDKESGKNLESSGGTNEFRSARNDADIDEILAGLSAGGASGGASAEKKSVVSGGDSDPYAESGVGRGASDSTKEYDPSDPFAFLNEDCPLERKDAKDLIVHGEGAGAGLEQSKFLRSSGIASEVARSIKTQIPTYRTPRKFWTWTMLPPWHKRKKRKDRPLLLDMVFRI